MTNIQQLLKTKGRGYYCVSPSESVYAAIQLMADKDIGSLLVMEGDALKGIITERHYARNVMLRGRTSPGTLVKEIMEVCVACAEPEESIESALETMTRERTRHLPVIKGGKVIGIVSIGDLVKSIIDDQRFAIDQLESYIHGDPCSHPDAD
jgi:CBS domain-containing protein